MMEISSFQKQTIVITIVAIIVHIALVMTVMFVNARHSKTLGKIVTNLVKISIVSDSIKCFIITPHFSWRLLLHVLKRWFGS